MKRKQKSCPNEPSPGRWDGRHTSLKKGIREITIVDLFVATNGSEAVSAYGEKAAALI